jgi:hypothetical protein
MNESHRSAEILNWLAALVAAAAIAGGWTWRLSRRAARPQTWPADLDLETEASLVRRYLKQNGWTLLPQQPWLRLLVRAKKNNAAWLNLVIQNRTTPGLRMTILDLIDRSQDHEATIGILTREPILDDHLELVKRGRLFLITHDQLPDAEAIVKQAARRIQRDVAAAKADAAERLAAVAAAAID